MKKIVFLAVALIIILGLGLAIYIPSNYEMWRQITSTKVSKNGEFSQFSRVYESNEGDYLVVSRDSRFGSAGYFIIYTKSNNVGVFMPSGNQPLSFSYYALVPRDRGNVALASNEKLPAKLKLNDKQIEITGTVIQPKWQILACLKDCGSE